MPANWQANPTLRRLIAAATLVLLVAPTSLGAGEPGAPRRGCKSARIGAAIGALSGLALGGGLAFGATLWGDDGSSSARNAFLMTGLFTGIGALVGLDIGGKRCEREHIEQSIERERERLQQRAELAAVDRR